MKTAPEIYADIMAHQIKGLMVHSQLADYYMLAGLTKYAKCHEKHYKKESKAWRDTSKYYIEHFNRLIPEIPIDNPDVIPKEWYGATRQEVDTNTKRKAVERGLAIWVDWETDTKILYQKSYTALMELGEIAAALNLQKSICDVDSELAEAQRYHLNKKSTGYDISYIVSEQDD